jgi:hypothetical protein
MPVFEGSRYENALQLRVSDAAGNVRPALYSMISGVPALATHTTYVMQEGDRYDEIANRLFGDPQLWWIIADLNPEYLYPDAVPAGSVIRLPLS